MNDKNHPNHPDYDPRTGEIDDGAVMDGEIVEPIGTGVLATIHRVEIDQQVATAKQYPRNVPKIKQELTALVTMDEDTADDCIYALPRGQKHIKGPSARFADALISFWGNARSGAFITQVDKENKFVEAIGMFQDVERNVIRQRRVRRPISGRDGRIYNPDMINMTGNAACVIAERNAILNGIPKSLWGPAYEQAFALVAGTTKTLGEKLERATKAFALHGITMEQVLEKLERQDISKVVPDDIATMRGMLTALKTGEETVETIFGRGAGGHQHETIKNPLKDDPEKVMDTVADSRRDNVQRQAAGSGKEDPISSGPIKAETASSEVEKDDKTSVASEKPAEEGSAGPAQESGQHGNNAQPAQAGAAAGISKTGVPAKPYVDGETYIAFMRDKFDGSGRAAIVDLWGSTRADRNEFLTREQIDALAAEKNAALTKLKEKG